MKWTRMLQKKTQKIEPIFGKIYKDSVRYILNVDAYNNVVKDLEKYTSNT